MHKDYEKITKEYIKISSDTRKKLTALCLTLIAAIYFFSDASHHLNVNQQFLKIALVFYVLTIVGEVFAGFFKSQHYSLWFEDKIEDIDFRRSIWGWLAECLFWLPLASLIIGTVYFFMGIFN